WGNDIDIGKSHEFKIIAINDLAPAWSGTVHLQIKEGEKILIDKSTPLTLLSYGKKTLSITCEVPNIPGLYTVQAVLEKKGVKPVKSIREIMFK
ncbi:MAG: hypothetical protein ACTHK8_21665, partial [Ginsengibacter sp.]